MAAQAVTYIGREPGDRGDHASAAAGADAIAGILLQPTDGSEAIVTVLCDAWGVRVADPFGAARVDVLGRPAAGRRRHDQRRRHRQLPRRPGLRAWVKAAIRAACPGVNFSDDFA